MTRIAEGDGSAFEVLVQRHQSSILNLIYRCIGDREYAQDLAQEVFFKVWQAAKNYKPEAKFTTWIYRITINLCLNELKAARRRRWFHTLQTGGGSEAPSIEDLSDDSPSAEDLLLMQERNRRISDALQGLPSNQRLALILKRYDGLSYQEISQILGCSVSAVESLIVRAKKNLQKRFAGLEK